VGAHLRTIKGLLTQGYHNLTLGFSELVLQTSTTWISDFGTSDFYLGILDLVHYYTFVDSVLCIRILAFCKFDFMLLDIFSISYWNLIKFPYFADTTEVKEGIGGKGGSIIKYAINIFDYNMHLCESEKI